MFEDQPTTSQFEEKIDQLHPEPTHKEITALHVQPTDVFPVRRKRRNVGVEEQEHSTLDLEASPSKKPFVYETPEKDEESQGTKF